MLTTLRAHLMVLNELKLLLEEEKEVLIKLDNENLKMIIDKKSEKIDKIESIEKHRMESFDDMSFKFFIKKNSEAKEITSQIDKTIEGIRDLQEMNTMLTKQSMDYNSNLMNMIQRTLKKSAMTYGYNGEVKGTNLGTKGSLDQSV
ncbi:MAG: flagellar export chaperone FlgN [Bacillota bacterium]|nr:flagellar export chaperone FlgN [Bacillota bacterium]